MAKRCAEFAPGELPDAQGSAASAPLIRPSATFSPRAGRRYTGRAAELARARERPGLVLYLALAGQRVGGDRELGLSQPLDLVAQARRRRWARARLLFLEIPSAMA